MNCKMVSAILVASGLSLIGLGLARTKKIPIEAIDSKEAVAENSDGTVIRVDPNQLRKASEIVKQYTSTLPEDEEKKYCQGVSKLLDDLFIGVNSTKE